MGRKDFLQERQNTCRQYVISCFQINKKSELTRGNSLGGQGTCIELAQIGKEEGVGFGRGDAHCGRVAVAESRCGDRHSH